ncbi:calcium uniporter regulatory subunit MCUb, mitochondrial isoform X1 [Bufo gargarizans]|uniref:calcium uniporter regulatory subunit MCUb, mitochondrial isoform X1 n=1 Tax=Bufo gargarizans TaxID=30331 RepID=UPI001CF545A7|nr:calcium uniporter regulatory subunit MCUb, mitochondrial isoform X1 [Bufo gargarizans]
MPILVELWRRLPLAAGYQARNVRHRLQFCTGVFYSTQPPSSDVTVQYNHGLPVVTLTLPSRNERCQFTIKPMTTTVGQFLKDIQQEDKGIDRVAAMSTDGTKFSSSTLMNVLLQNDFQLVINKSAHHVSPPPIVNLQSERSEQLDPIKCMIQDLHTVFYYDDYLVQKEQQLLQRLENLKEELQPLEQMKKNLMTLAEARTTHLKWVGLALLSTQGGALAWLTWWVYSWDIMEPVTYFITYGSAIAFYAYFLLTKLEYLYPEVSDRQFLHIFYRKAKVKKLDIEKYNRLKNEFAKTEESLRRLRSPLQLKLPIEQLHGRE